MEVTGYNSDTVHALRQGFTPNAPFKQALSELVQAGHTEPRLFSVWGSDERIVDAMEITSVDFQRQKHDADAAYEKRRHALLQPSLEFSARVLQAGPDDKRGNVALQLVMKPANFLEYSQLRSTLDIVKLGHRQQAFGFTASRLYMNIPFEQLRSVDEVKEGIAAIKTRLPAGPSDASLFQLLPDERLHGEFRAYQPTIQPKGQPGHRRAS